MRLSHLKNLIDTELEAVIRGMSQSKRPASGYLVDGDIRQLVEDEPKFRNQVDLAVEHWGVHRTWPANPEIAQYILQRFISASEFLTAASSLNLETDTEESHVLAWLLSDYWRCAGCFQWIHRVKSH
jgi:hypothetical protein